MQFPPKKKSALEAPEPIGKPKPPKPEPTELDVLHEQGESNMDFGAIGAKFGLTEDESKAFAHDVLEACMKATGGAAHEENEPEVAEESMFDENDK